MASDQLKKIPRLIVRVLPHNNGWILRSGNLYSLWAIKEQAVLRGRILCTHYHQGKAQLIIHKRNGQIQTEHTYKADPVRYKG